MELGRRLNVDMENRIIYGLETRLRNEIRSPSILERSGVCWEYFLSTYTQAENKIWDPLLDKFELGMAEYTYQ